MINLIDNNRNFTGVYPEDNYQSNDNDDLFSPYNIYNNDIGGYDDKYALPFKDNDKDDYLKVYYFQYFSLELMNLISLRILI